MKNFYALNAGEFFVAQEILKNRKDIRLFFPIKDDGVDLLAVKNNSTRPTSIQVKESRIYPQGFAWHQVRPEKIKDADVFVFVSYVPIERGGKTEFEKDFVVIPSGVLLTLCESKKLNKGKYSFYFAKEDNKLFDVRDGRVEVTKFCRAWDLL